jgi:hypothetical protein
MATVDALLEKVNEIAPLIRAHAEAAEQARRLAHPVVEAMQHRFQRYFRDVHTMTQHAFVCASRYESVGALLLGVTSDGPFFAF